VLEHKSCNVSETRKDRAKSYYGGPIGIHQRSFERYHPRPGPPTASPAARLGFATPNPHPKLQSLLSQAQLYRPKATDFKFDQNIHRIHPNKSPLEILEKRERGHIQGLSKFSYYLERVKLQTSNFVGSRHIYRLNRNYKSPLRISGKIAVGI